MRLTVLLLASLLWCTHPAGAEPQMHFEGYWRGLALTAPGDSAFSLGQVTTIFRPLASNMSTSEYTYQIRGLVSRGSTTADSNSFRTQYDVSHASITIFEDPSQDARPTFYNCPADIAAPPAADPRYADGTIYLKGHFLSFETTYDRSEGYGSVIVTVNWDAGSHIGDLPPASRGGGGATGFADGSFDTFFSCIPSGYSQASSEQLERLATPARAQTWGSLRRIYR